MRAAILGLLLVLSTTAHADDKAKAKALYDEGLKHYNVAEYQEAIKAWKEAYLLVKKPILLFNIGQAYRLSGECKQAMTFYDSYQREDPSPKNQDELDQALSLCKQQLDKPDRAGEKKPDKPEKPEKPVDKPVAPVQPTVKPPVVAQKPIEPPERPEPASPARSGSGLRKIGIGVGVAGVVLGGAAIYFALDSRSASSDLDGYTGPWGTEQQDTESRGKRSALLGWVLGGAGVAAIAAGSVMFVVGGPKGETSTVSVVPTRSGVHVGWAVRF